MQENEEADDFFYIPASQKHIKKERAKAKILRQSGWWKNEKAKGTCYWCKQSFVVSDLTMDHKIPISRGGFSNKGNIVPCCKECNSEKQSKTEVEWKYFFK